MLYFNSPTKNPYFNLALEEYLFEKYENETVFLLWQNSNTIVIGKYQNPVEEINQSYVNEHHIYVARRLSGGGAVYHDGGNLNYTFIIDADKNPDFNFQLFIRPVLRTLEKMGIHAEFNGRNDITLNGAKFCGNSQYYKGGRVLHHGCIMLDSNLDTVSNALKAKQAKFDSKSVKSVRSRVTCINHHTDKPVTMHAFKNMLLDSIQEDEPLIPLNLSDEDLIAIQKLRDEKYMTWEWNYGHTPEYNMRVEKKFPAGLITAFVLVKNQTIENIQFNGDFFGKGNLSELENYLKGLRLDQQLITHLRSFNIDHYMYGITAEQLAELLL